MPKKLDMGSHYFKTLFARIMRKNIRDLGRKIMKKKVKRIRAGKVIKRAYAASTKIKRRRAGLQTSHVDLTGNSAYYARSIKWKSRKSESNKKKKERNSANQAQKGGWRLLDEWKIKITGKKTIVAVWKHKRAKQIYEYQVRRYGEIFRKA